MSSHDTDLNDGIGVQAIGYTWVGRESEPASMSPYWRAHLAVGSGGGVVLIHPSEFLVRDEAQEMRVEG